MTKKITKEDYHMTLQVLYSWAAMLNMLPLQECYDAANLADTVGPFLDPTLYRENSRKMHEDMKLLQSFISLRKTFLEMEGEQ